MCLQVVHFVILLSSSRHSLEKTMPAVTSKRISNFKSNDLADLPVLHFSACSSHCLESPSAAQTIAALLLTRAATP